MHRSVALLRSELTPMFGRSQDVNAVIALLESRRLVTLTGAAGFGKTRLARACGRALDGRPQWESDRVWFADLTPCRGDDDALATIADALGIGATLRPASPAKSQIRDFLVRSQPGVLILDNAEHLVPLVRDHVDTWLRAAEQLHILVTSREALDLPGEQRYVVGPLDLPAEHGSESAALQLFASRAQAADPSLNPKEHRVAITELVTRLDGNPLAIELAAARCALFSPAQLVDRLDRRFELLTRSGAAAGSLWSSLEESWVALNADEQYALLALSLFRRGASVEAAEALVAGPPTQDSANPVDLLTALIRKSLVVTTVAPACPEVRRLDLYESIREFARVKLEQQAHQELVKRHRDWFRTYASRLAARELQRRRSTEVLTAVVLDLDNLLDMFEHGLDGQATFDTFTVTARGLLDLWMLLADQWAPAVRMRLLRKARSRAAELPERMRLQLQGEFARTLLVGVEPDRVEMATTLFQEAIEGARALGDKALEGGLRLRAAKLLDVAPAEPIIESLVRATALLDGDEYRWERGTGLCVLGLAHLRRGDYDAAARAFDAALTLARGHGLWDVTCLALNNYALLNGWRGQWAEAKSQLSEAIALIVPNRLPALECVIRGNLGECCLVDKRHEEAERWIRQSAAIAARCGYWRQLAMSTAYLAGLEHLRGRPQEALKGYAEAKKTFALTYEDPLPDGIVAAVVAVAHAQLGHADDAQNALEVASNKLGGVGDPIVERALAVYRLTVDYALKRTRLDDTRAQVQRIFAEAEAMMPSRPPPHRLHLVQHAMTMFEAGVTPLTSDGPNEEPQTSPPLILRQGARSLQLPSGEVMDLGRRPQARRIIELLARQRQQAPGKSVDAQLLFDAGWPDDGVAEPYRSNRVYVTMTRLRSAGLGPYLLHDGEGYLLDPTYPVQIR